MEKENQLYPGEFYGKGNLTKRIIKSSFLIIRTIETAGSSA